MPVENCIWSVINGEFRLTEIHWYNGLIYFYNKGRFKYEGLMLTGTMEVLQDNEIKKEIWQMRDTMYYKHGVSDPDYCVLKFTAVKGRHYCDLKSDSFHLEELE